MEIDDNDIIYCRAIANDTYNESDLAALRDEMISISKGEPFFIVMEMKEFEILLTRKARTFLGNDQKSAEFVKAEAIVLQSNTVRILFNLLTIVNKPQFPFRAFNKEIEAIEWLKSFQ